MHLLHLQCLRDAPDRAVEIASILAGTGLPAEKIHVVRPFDDSCSVRYLDGMDALLIGGAGWSVFEDVPHYGAFRALVREARVRGLPTLGICFGAQALADIFGGDVIRDEETAEYGTILVRREPGCRDSLLHGCPGRFRAQAWHHDRIKVLPPGALPLAWSGGRRRILQAFGFPGERVWGVQFHPERTSDTFDRLLGQRCAPCPAHPIAAIRARLKPSPIATDLMRRFVSLAASAP